MILFNSLDGWFNYGFDPNDPTLLIFVAFTWPLWLIPILCWLISDKLRKYLANKRQLHLQKKEKQLKIKIRQEKEAQKELEQMDQEIDQLDLELDSKNKLKV